MCPTRVSYMPYSETPSHRKETAMTKLALAKKVATTVVSLSVGRVISSIIVNNTTVITPTDKVAAVTSSYVLGAMVGDYASDYTAKAIDDAAAWWKENVSKS